MANWSPLDGVGDWRSVARAIVGLVCVGAILGAAAAMGWRVVRTVERLVVPTPCSCLVTADE